MIRVHIYNWVTCSWQYVWRPISVVRAMRHLTLAATIACTGITVWPPAPPVEAHGPPPPAQTVIAPPPSWGFPPAWGGYTPPASTWPAVPTDIPLGPVQPVPEGARHTFSPVTPEFSREFTPEFSREFSRDVSPVEVISLPPGCDITVITPPASTVSEPGAFGLFAVGTFLLLLWRGVRHDDGLPFVIHDGDPE